MSAVSRVTAKILELHAREGFPSSRAVAHRTDGAVSHTTVAYLLSGKRCPRWSVLAHVAEALGATQADMRELRELWDAAEEVRKVQRQTARAPRRIREGLVIRPGDTVVITVDGDVDDPEALVEQVTGQFPDNKVKVIIGGSIAVIRPNEEVAA